MSQEPLYFKATRLDGTDFYVRSESVDYEAGKTVRPLEKYITENGVRGRDAPGFSRGEG
jgi:hypothetical protein